MKSLDEIHQRVANALSLPLRDIPLEVPPSANLGDVCFNLFKAAKPAGKSPTQLAKETADKIRRVEGVREITPMNGFLNVSLELNALTALLNCLLEKGEHSFPDAGTAQRVMVEYFSPNTNKPLHIGHLRNLFIGDALSRTLSVLEHSVIRAILYNDRGIHIEKAQLAYERFGMGATPASQRKKGDQFIGEYYVRFGREAAAHPTLEDEARTSKKSAPNGT